MREERKKVMKLKIGAWSLWAESTYGEEYRAVLVRDGIRKLAHEWDERDVFFSWGFRSDDKSRVPVGMGLPQATRIVCDACLQIYSATGGTGPITWLTDADFPEDAVAYVRNEIVDRGCIV